MTMRYFTPQLFAQFNSASDDEADQADEAWEKALTAYRSHLAGIENRLPSQVRKLAELSLHDAEFLDCEQMIEPITSLVAEAKGYTSCWSAVAVISVRDSEHITSLIYVLTDRIRELAAPSDWPCSKLRTHWLYDEIDLAPSDSGGFLHQVLLSDGRVLEIPFAMVFVHQLPTSRLSSVLTVRQIA